MSRLEEDPDWTAYLQLVKASKTTKLVPFPPELARKIMRKALAGMTSEELAQIFDKAATHEPGAKKKNSDSD